MFPGGVVEEEAGLVRSLRTIVAIVAHCTAVISVVSQLHNVVKVTGYSFMMSVNKALCIS